MRQHLAINKCPNTLKPWFGLVDIKYLRGKQKACTEICDCDIVILTSYFSQYCFLFFFSLSIIKPTKNDFGHSENAIPPSTKSPQFLLWFSELSRRRCV